MTRKREGAAIRQETRAQRKRPEGRQPVESIAERTDFGEFRSLSELVATCLVGSLFLFCFMWLAAAY